MIRHIHLHLTTVKNLHCRFVCRPRLCQFSPMSRTIFYISDLMTRLPLFLSRSSTRRCRGLECSTTEYPSQCPPRRFSTCGSARMNISTSFSFLTTSAPGKFLNYCYLVHCVIQNVWPRQSGMSFKKKL